MILWQKLSSFIHFFYSQPFISVFPFFSLYLYISPETEHRGTVSTLYNGHVFDLRLSKRTKLLLNKNHIFLLSLCMRVLNSRIEIWVEILFLRHHVSIPIFQIELKLCCYDENVFRSNFSLFKIFPYLLYFSPSPLYSSFPNLHLLYSSFHHLYLVYIPPSPAFISFIFLLPLT